MKLVRYFTRIPKKIPEGCVAFHNFRPGDPERKPDENGFRLYFGRLEADEKLGPPCDCGWSWKGGIEHYEPSGIRNKVKYKPPPKADPKIRHTAYRILHNLLLHNHTEYTSAAIEEETGDDGGGWSAFPSLSLRSGPTSISTISPAVITVAWRSPWVRPGRASARRCSSGRGRWTMSRRR